LRTLEYNKKIYLPIKIYPLNKLNRIEPRLKTLTGKKLSVPDLADKNPAKPDKVLGDAVSYFWVYKKRFRHYRE
jgi:hypothetical protein